MLCQSKHRNQLFLPKDSFFDNARLNKNAPISKPAEFHMFVLAKYDDIDSL